MIAPPPFAAGAVKAMLACVFPGVAEPIVGAPGGTTDTGVTITLPEDTLVPPLPVAVTLQVYGVPMTRPVSVIGELAPFIGDAPLLQVTV